MDVTSAERELDSFIERRARQAEDDRRTEEAWKETARRYNARRREENRAAWCEHFERLAAYLRARAQEYDRRATQLSETKTSE